MAHLIYRITQPSLKLIENVWIVGLGMYKAKCPEHLGDLVLVRVGYGNKMDIGKQIEIYRCPEINCLHRYEVKFDVQETRL